MLKFHIFSVVHGVWNCPASVLFVFFPLGAAAMQSVKAHLLWCNLAAFLYMHPQPWCHICNKCPPISILAQLGHPPDKKGCCHWNLRVLSDRKGVHRNDCVHKIIFLDPSWFLYLSSALPSSPLWNHTDLLYIYIIIYLHSYLKYLSINVYIN